MWFKHPKYLVARSNFCSEFTPWKLTYLHYSLPKVIFICGGSEKICPNRNIIEEYFQKHLPHILTFRAEDAWEIISQDKSANALSLEEWLADFSDVVIILVESFGTVAELGAFSLSPNLRRKLLPILDKSHSRDESFINTGPIRWVDKDSKFGPSIQANFQSILTCVPEIETRINIRTIDAIYAARTFGSYNFTNKVILFFLVYLVAALGPISIKEIVGVTNDIIKYKDKKVISFILSVGVALNIFRVINIDKIEYITCVDYKKLFRDSSAKLFLNNIQTSRARSLSSLSTIPEFKKLLEKVVQNVA
jgi:hypothetical protein